MVLAQFLKDGTSSECRALAKLGNITMLAANPSSKFSFQMTEEEKQECSAAIGRTFAAATGFAVREGATPVSYTHLSCCRPAQRTPGWHISLRRTATKRQSPLR